MVTEMAGDELNPRPPRSDAVSTPLDLLVPVLERPWQHGARPSSHGGWDGRRRMAAPRPPNVCCCSPTAGGTSQRPNPVGGLRPSGSRPAPCPVTAQEWCCAWCTSGSNLWTCAPVRICAVLELTPRGHRCRRPWSKFPAEATRSAATPAPGSLRCQCRAPLPRWRGRIRRLLLQLRILLTFLV
jgi:hypothetical protein